MQKNIGFILLAIFLIVYGLLLVSSITFVMSNVLLGALAIGAAVFILLGK